MTVARLGHDSGTTVFGLTMALVRCCCNCASNQSQECIRYRDAVESIILMMSVKLVIKINNPTYKNVKKVLLTSAKVAI